MTRFFERLNQYTRAMGQGPPEYLRTHPLTVNRIAEARSRAESVSRRQERDGEEFHFVQARLRVLTNPYQEQNIDWFEVRLDRQDRPAEAMRYGLILALIQTRRFDEAEQHLQQLLASNSQRQIYRLLEAELRLAQDHQPEALEILTELYRHFPGNRMVTTQYAETLMHNRQIEHAELATSVLRRFLRNHPNDLHMTELLAQAADTAGEKVRAAEAIADSYYLRGGVAEAIEQLERISERDDLDYYQRARINARLAELRSEHVRLVSRNR
jgi:beta-barrel assembly-enhancing protease